MTQAIELTKAQRAAAIDRIADSLALRSGAGCGKTFVLARRYIELLKASPPDSNPLSELVALTFTDKAALEMSQRVRKMLVELSRQGEDADQDKTLRDRARAWVDQLGDARIGTIHSFCSALLRANAVEAGIDPSFAVCSDPLQAARMLAEAADDACLEAVEGEQEGLVELILRVPYDQLVGTVAELVDLRTTCRMEDYLDPQATLERWRQMQAQCGQQAWGELAADAEFAASLDAAEAFVCSDPDDRLEVYRRQQLDTIRQLLDDPASRTVEMFDILSDKPGGAIGAASAWGGKEMPKLVRDAVKAVVLRAMALRAYVEPLNELDVQAAQSLAAMGRLAGRAEERYSRAKRSAGLLDFTDLLYHACRVLRANPALRRRLAGQIRQLLIDECQDTDSFQVELLMMLVDPDGQGSTDVPEGRLFLVGDAKQSIYRFRGAQLEVFEDLCRRLGPTRQEDLNLSFRSHPGVVEFVNHLFAPLMGTDYSAIKAKRPQAPPQPSVEILLAEGEDGPIETAGQASRAQATLVAQRIARMIADRERLVWDAKAEAWRPVRPGDIAILFARMTNSLQYEQELQKLEVPYYVLGGLGFFQQQEIFDVLNALRAVDNPLDDIALLGVLRSSLVGLDDNALLHLARTYRPPYFPHLLADLRTGRTALKAVLSPPQIEALAQAVDLIARLHRRKDASGIERTLADLLDATAYEATLLAQFQGKRMLGNVRMLLERAANAGRQGVCLAEFVQQLDELVAAEQRYEQAAVEGEAQDVVRIMTIHKAKGLEFPVVFVPDLNAGRRGHLSPLLRRRDWGLTLNVKPEPGDEGPQEGVSHSIALKMENADQVREDIRKLYVALTRAKDHLVLVGANWLGEKGFQRGGCYLSMMDGPLRLREALAEGRAEIPYHDGRFAARLAVVQPEKRAGAFGGKSSGARMLAQAGSAEELGRRMVEAAEKVKSYEGLSALVGPLPASVGAADVAVTALSEFEHCPMLYRWRYELRVPEINRPPAPVTQPFLAPTDTPPPGPQAGMPELPEPHAGMPELPVPLDGARLGTLLHRCLELVDFAHPQPAQVLAGQALAEMELDQAGLALAVSAELEAMLRAFQAHPLWGSIASARQVFRELDFVLACPGSVLRGQIDLLYQSGDGAWHIVDYKSNRIADEGLAPLAAVYELQMLAYGLAARRFHGQAPADATLYFLRPGAAHAFTLDEPALDSASRRLEDLLGSLNAARRSGRFERKPAKTCEYCLYSRLCMREGCSPRS